MFIQILNLVVLVLILGAILLKGERPVPQNNCHTCPNCGFEFKESSGGFCPVCGLDPSGDSLEALKARHRAKK